MHQAKLWAVTLAAGLLLLSAWACAGSNNVPRLDRDTLKSWLADPQVIILDVRIPQDWATSDIKIKGALRRDPEAVKTWGPGLPKDKKIVLYCS